MRLDKKQAQKDLQEEVKAFLASGRSIKRLPTRVKRPREIRPYIYMISHTIGEKLKGKL